MPVQGETLRSELADEALRKGMLEAIDGVVVGGERHAVKWEQHGVSDCLVMRLS